MLPIRALTAGAAGRPGEESRGACGRVPAPGGRELSAGPSPQPAVERTGLAASADASARASLVAPGPKA